MALPGRPSLLLLDDNETDLPLAREHLASVFDVVATSAAKDALAAVARRTFDVMVVSAGFEIAGALSVMADLRRLQPSARRVLMGDAADSAVVLASIDAGEIHRVVQRPPEPEALSRWLSGFPPTPRGVRGVVVASDAEAGHRAVAALAGASWLSVTEAATVKGEVGDDLVLFVAPKSVAALAEALLPLRAGRTRPAVLAALDPILVNDAAGYLGAGIDDIVWLPLREQELMLRFQTWRDKREAEREAERLRAHLISRSPFPQLVGRSPSIQRAFQQLNRVAPTNASVLITGPTGTGKELIARALHELSRRRAAPFLAVNLSAMPETLVESELFGHERGAFTGARDARVGRLEAAQGGTLFLDEIGDLSAGIQVKLLRVIEQLTFERLGSSSTRTVDFRLVCATHQNLEELIAQGKFREDLYYRINVVCIEVPPLRERGDDIRLLAEHFLDSYRQSYGIKDLCLSDAAMRALLRHDWPGNVRELKHLMERVVAMSRDRAVIEEDVLWVRSPRGSFRQDIEGFWNNERGLKQVLGDIERQILLESMHRLAGNQVAVAKKLKIPRQTLQNRLKKYGL